MFASRELLASLVLHGMVVLAIGLWTPSLQDSTLSDQSLPIEIITIDEFTKLLEDTAQPEEEPREEPVAFEQAAAPEALQPDAMPVLEQQKPQAETETIKTENPVPDEPQFKVAKPVPLARPARKPKPILDLGQVRALLNKKPTQNRPTAGWGRSASRKAAEANKLTVSEVDSFRAQMRRCWSPPAGAREAENLIVQVRVSLTPSGSISAGPKVVNRQFLSDPFFRAAAESVLRAIRRCQPFRMPPKKYASWRNIELTFDPSKMLGR